MAILRFNQQAVKAKLQRKSIKELASKLGQRSQPTAPNYAESTKLGTGFGSAVGTSNYVLLSYSSPFAIFLRRRLTRPD
jgi:hypothetical protein